MRRRDNGALLRAAMAQAGLSVRALAARTQEIDPTGKGVAAATVGRVTTDGSSGRDSIKDAAAELIAAALQTPAGSLFDEDASRMLEVSTISQRSKTSAVEVNGIPCMVDAQTLAAVIRKHLSWIYAQPNLHPTGSATPFPVHYAGRSPRYYIHEVVAWMDAVQALIAA